MRLRTFGLAMTAAIFVALITGRAIAAQQGTADLLGGTPDAASVLAYGTALADHSAPLQSPLSEHFGKQSGVAYPDGARAHLALVTPSIVQRSSAAAAAPNTVGASTSTPQEQPSLWLMCGVALLLIGYQLRRKHRFLRPHRFNAL